MVDRLEDTAQAEEGEAQEGAMAWALITVVIVACACTLVGMCWLGGRADERAKKEYDAMRRADGESEKQR